MKTPFNDAVVIAIRGHGVGTLKPGPKNLWPLIEMLRGLPFFAVP